MKKTKQRKVIETRNPFKQFLVSTRWEIRATTNTTQHGTTMYMLVRAKWKLMSYFHISLCSQDGRRGLGAEHSHPLLLKQCPQMRTLSYKKWRRLRATAQDTPRSASRMHGWVRMRGAHQEVNHLIRCLTLLLTWRRTLAHAIPHRPSTVANETSHHGWQWLSGRNGGRQDWTVNPMCFIS